MKLAMSYAEFSLLREVVKAKQVALWETKWLPILKRRDKMSPVEIRAAFERKMNRESVAFDTISSDEDCCSMLLRRFREMETEFQKSVGRER